MFTGLIFWVTSDYTETSRKRLGIMENTLNVSRIQIKESDLSFAQSLSKTDGLITEASKQARATDTLSAEAKRSADATEKNLTELEW